VKLSLVLGAALIGLAGCSGNDLTSATATNLDHPGLDQHVVLSTPVLTVGEPVTVRSVVVNRGSAPDTLLVLPMIRLNGVAFAQPMGDTLNPGPAFVYLAPGDSLVAVFNTAPVTALPGNYSLTVYQLASPGTGIVVPVRVQPAAPAASTHATTTMSESGSPRRP
jgi:hypothetical protein